MVFYNVVQSRTILKYVWKEKVRKKCRPYVQGKFTKMIQAYAIMEKMKVEKIQSKARWLRRSTENL